MRRFLSVLWCFCGVLVFPEIFPLDGSFASQHAHADVGDFTDEEYAALMLYFMPQDEPEQDVADAVYMLLSPPEPEFDHDGFMEDYWQIMNEMHPISE